MASLQRILNLFFVYVLCFVLLSSYLYQFMTGIPPCPLCLLQRLAIIGITIGILLNLRFGIKAEHYGLSVLSAILGRTVSLRQIALHVCPFDSLPYDGLPLLGLNLYVWAFLVFGCSLVIIAVLLILFGFTDHRPVPPIFKYPEKIALWLVVFLALAGAVTTFVA